MTRPRFFQKVRLESKIDDLGTVTTYEKVCWFLKHLFPLQSDGPVDFSGRTVPEDFVTDLRIVSVGDLMYMGRDYDLDSFLPEWNARFGDALKIGNLETPLALSRPPTPWSSVIRFNASAKFWDQLRAMRFDILSVANNHAMDMGEAGLRETCELLRQDGVLPIGTSLVPEDSIGHEGRRIGLLAFTYGTNREPTHPAVNRFPYYRDEADAFQAEIEERVRALRDRCDLVVLALHWGPECETSPDPEIRRRAAGFVEAGADLVLGHHPHVVQPVEQMQRSDGREALVLYSQGNFLARALHPLMRTGHAFDVRIRFDDGRLRMAWAVHRVVTPVRSLRTRFA